MTTQFTERLNDLLDLWEEGRSRGELTSVDELCRESPDLLPLLKEQIAKLEQMNEWLVPTENWDGEAKTAWTLGESRGDAESAAMEMGTTLETCARYRMIRSHAKGGLGEVLVAEDQQLKRQVALKRIQATHDRDPERRRRFLWEAEITSRLEHPGIVPVHGVGQDNDGRPCYTMRLVQGDTLQQAIQRFHETNKDDGDFSQQRAELRHLLTRFITVCNTIAYAHSQGVIHRDLKPANIMLGPYGETLVVDWGLAKQMTSLSVVRDLSSMQETHDPQATDNEPKTTNQEPSLTQTGATLGTPAFMSPEQTTGRPEEMGPASDIYSLGATLYVLLTGKLPFESNSLAELLSRVQRGDFAMPQTILPSLPKSLEAICLKAMSREPSQRYASALDMAADLDHWLADEPVKAHRESLGARIGRFVRRHRAWTMSGAAALAVIAVIATVSAFWINGQKQVITKQERAATQMADRNATLAEQEKSARQKADLNAAATLRLTKLAERHLYFAHMNLAQSAWESPAVNQTVHLLELYRPLKLARTESEVTSRDSSLALRASLPHLTQTEELGSRDDLRGFEWFYWDHCCHSELLTLKGHSDGVTSVAVSPDGRRIASASWDRTVKVWDAITSQELLTLKGHTASISCVVFSPDGQRLASVSLDQTGKVWDAATGQELLALKGHSGKLWSVAFSPDGQRLASGSSDGTIKWWDAVTGQELSTQKGHKSDVMSVAFSLDGKQLASAGWDHTVKVWDAVTGQETLFLEGHSDACMSVAFSPDGTQLASASRDMTIKLWGAASGRELLTLKGHTHPVTSIGFSPDGQRLASTGNDQTVKVWDVAAGQELLAFKGHTHDINSVVYSRDGQRLISASVDRTIRIWDANAQQVSVSLKGQIGEFTDVAFSPNGLRLASVSKAHTVSVWDGTLGQEMFTLNGHTAEITSVAFSPDGHRIATASQDQTVKIWDATSGHELLALKGHAGGVSSVAFSPDCNYLASSSGDNTVKVWGMVTGQESLTLRGHNYAVTSVVFSTDGQRLASASQDRTIKLWDAATGQELLTLTGHAHEVTGVAFSPDGKCLASSSLDSTVKIWDTITGQESLTLRGHASGVSSVAFSTDGCRLVSTGWDHTIKLWDAITGQESLSLKDGTDPVLSVAFSPDGLRLASASLGQNLKIWDARPWTPELKLEQAALGILRFLCAQPISQDTLVRKIHENQTISDTVRQRTLELAETYWLREERRWVNLPVYLTAERKQRNLLRNGSFETQTDNQDWTANSWRQNSRAAAIAEGVAQDGNRSVLLTNDVADDAYFAQEVAVLPNTDYLLCGWVKTEGVKLVEQVRNVGANLSVLGGIEHSQSVTGDSDWTYLTVKFNSGQRKKVKACARLGFTNSTCTGKAWFDDICLIALDNSHLQSALSLGR